jgi:hypothetical protein
MLLFLFVTCLHVGVATIIRSQSVTIVFREIRAVPVKGIHAEQPRSQAMHME